MQVYYDVEKRWMHGTIAECVVNSHMQIRYDNGYYDQLTKDQVATIALL